MSLYTAIGLVVAAMVVGVIAFVVIARRSPEGGLADRTPTNVYAVTGGAMSLLIAFTFAAAFGVYTSVQTAVRTEAAEVLSMYRATGFMDEPLRTELQDEIRCYAQLVSTTEWIQLANGQFTYSGPVVQTLTEMDQLVASPEGVKQAGIGLDIYESATDAMLAARVQRISSAEWSVPPIVYIMIIFGSLITIGSLVVFADRTKPAWGHALVIVGPIFVVSAGLTVTYFFDNPFTNTPGGVTPQAMQMVSAYMDADSGRPMPACGVSAPEGPPAATLSLPRLRG